MLNKEKLNTINYQKFNGLLPVIIQHFISGEVLMLGYMNFSALMCTCKTGLVTFFSRSRNELWVKGKTSGNYLKLIDIFMDCDNDTILIFVDPLGVTCHKNTSSCFFPAMTNLNFIFKLELIIKKFKKVSSSNSYTSSLFISGTKRIAQKVGEEGVEVALAALVKDCDELINEAADLLYHLLVLLQDRNIDFSCIVDKLKERHKK